ncbi:MAG: divergent polysaccharide deacetylase family protein [Emcibacteraceae bacterium]
MASEPELKTATRQKVLNPLYLAWGLVLLVMALIILWVYFSDEPAADINEMPATISEHAEEENTHIAVATEMPEQTSDAAEADTSPEETVNSQEPAEPVRQDLVNNTPQASSLKVPEQQISVQHQTLIDTQEPLKKAPNVNLLVKGDNGLLPVLGPDGLVAWKEYARPYTGPEDAPRIAILITDIGLNSKSSNAAIDDLPGQIDMAFSPYGRNLQDWMDKARAKGHEGILMLPTEPLNYPDNDPGPHSLLTNLSETDNLKRLDWLLSQVAGYVGVVNHMGSKFTASEEGMMPILNDLNSRGLMFIDSRSTRFSMAARLARQINMPRAMNDRFIDNVISPDEIKRQLAELEKTARTFGTALGLARATPLTIREIAAWAETLDQNGIQLVPITAIANRQPIK